MARSRKKKPRIDSKRRDERRDNRTATKNPHHRLPRRTLSFIVVGVFLTSVCVACLTWPSPSQQLQQQSDNDIAGAKVDVQRAAILDGLYNTSPNVTLTDALTILLSNAGYHVDVYRGENVTIKLLESISGYKLLILRVHSAIHTDGFLYLFSGESFADSKYVDERLTGAVRKAHTFNENESAYFALNAMFLGNGKPGSLNGSTIILTGCNGTGTPEVIQKLFDHGAKAYVSWNGYVDLSHSDEALFELVKALYADNLTADLAVRKVMTEVGPDPYYNSTLECCRP